MGVFSKLFGKGKAKKPDSPAFRRQMAESVSKQHIKYVTEKINDVDEVIGREGGLNIRNEEFIVFSSGKVVFRCRLDDLQIWELLSKDGVVLTGPDLETGRERTVVAFYVYHSR